MNRSHNSHGRSRPRRHLHRNLSSYHRRPLPLARLGSLHGTCSPLRRQLSRLELPTPRHVLRGCGHAAYVLWSTQTTPVPHPRRSDRADMAILRADLSTWPLLLVSPISSPPLVPPSRKGRRPTQRPQRHGSLQSPPPRTTTQSSPPRKTTMTPRRHHMTALETETQPADPHRHISSRTRGRTRPLRPRGRLDLQQ